MDRAQNKPNSYTSFWSQMSFQSMYQDPPLALNRAELGQLFFEML